MGEAPVALFRPDFNRSVRVVAADTVLTEDAAALLLRQASHRTGLDARLARLPDARDSAYTVYSIAELVRTRVLLLAQGWEDQGDANTLRFDPAFRLGVSGRAGETPLGSATHLPSQPTLSRMQHALADHDGIEALERTLCGQALDRVLRAEPNRRRLVIDLDTTPIEVFGHQDGSSYNSHYHCTCFQPLIAVADTGDLLAVRLRPGANPTAEDAFAFLAGVLESVRSRGLVPIVRMDAGFSNAHMMRELDRLRVRFVTRRASKPNLHVLSDAWYPRTREAWARTPAPDGAPRTATYEMWDKPQKSGRVRRILAVAVEAAPGELLGKRFYLCTNLARSEETSANILAFYRQRGAAEVFIGEYKRATVPSLRAVPRGKKPGTVTIRDNHVAVLLAGLAYNLVHALRVAIAAATREGWSLERVRERVLKVATQVVRHARQIVFRIATTKAALWAELGHLVCPGVVATGEVAR